MLYAFTFDYPATAGLIYGLTLATMLLIGIRSLTRDPTLVRQFATPRGRWTWASIAVLIIAMVAFFLSATIAGQISSWDFTGRLAIGLILSLSIALAVYPSAAERDGRMPRLPQRAQTNLFLVLFVLSGAWSFGLVPLITQFIEVKIVGGGIVDVVTLGRPLEFLMVCAFALAAPFLEEIIFRGGVQGGLEKTRLGTWGALIVASFLFALGHTTYIEPHGIKEGHVFVLGLIFGVARMRLGLTAAILLHFANNLAALALEVLMGPS